MKQYDINSKLHISQLTPISEKDRRRLQLETLIFFHEYCEKHNLRYFLAGGTLIGAIRHKGFIPWDDDIDVYMLRKDYDEFDKQFNKTSNNSQYAFVSLNNTEGYYLCAGKLIDNRTILKENITSKCYIGEGIDILPVDNMSDSKEEGVHLFRQVLFLRNILAIKTMKLNRTRKIYKNVILFVGKILFCIIPLKALLMRIDKKAKQYASDHVSKYVAAVTAALYGEKEVMTGNIFAEQVTLQFEGHTFYGPIGFDMLLRNLYGNYMELPPVEKRIAHHSVNSYWKQ